MPEGSSSAAPVIRPGPSTEKNCRTKFDLLLFSLAILLKNYFAPWVIGRAFDWSRNNADLRFDNQSAVTMANSAITQVFAAVPRLSGENGYVHPRSRKIKSRIGMGMPKSHNKIYPVAPVSSILCFRFISSFLTKKSEDSDLLRSSERL